MYVCARICERMHICVHMCTLCAYCGMNIEVSRCLAELFLSFHLVALGDQTQGIRHGSKYGPSWQPTIAYHIYIFFFVFLYSIFIHWNDNNLKYLIQWLQEYNKALFRRKRVMWILKTHTVSPSLDNWKSNWEKAAWGTQECRWLTRPSPS